jgi:hypothetical protein
VSCASEEDDEWRWADGGRQSSNSRVASDFFDVSRVLARIMERFAFVYGAGGRLLSCQLRRFLESSVMSVIVIAHTSHRKENRFTVVRLFAHVQL